MLHCPVNPRRRFWVAADFPLGFRPIHIHVNISSEISSRQISGLASSATPVTMGREATHPRSTRILQELGDPDRADEIAEEPLEDYAQRRRIQITNPSKRFDVDTTVLNLVVQLWQQVKRRQNWKRRSPICRTKTRNSKTSLTRSPIS